MLSAVAECPLQDPKGEELQLPGPVTTPRRPFSLSWLPLPLCTPAAKTLPYILGLPEGLRDSGALLSLHREPPGSPELLAASDPPAPM